MFMTMLLKTSWNFFFAFQNCTNCLVFVMSIWGIILSDVDNFLLPFHFACIEDDYCFS